MSLLGAARMDLNRNVTKQEHPPNSNTTNEVTTTQPAIIFVEEANASHIFGLLAIAKRAYITKPGLE